MLPHFVYCFYHFIPYIIFFRASAYCLLSFLKGMNGTLSACVFFLIGIFPKKARMWLRVFVISLLFSFFKICQVDWPVKFYCVDLGITEVNSGSQGFRSRKEIEQLPLDYLGHLVHEDGESGPMSWADQSGFRTRSVLNIFCAQFQDINPLEEF